VKQLLYIVRLARIALLPLLLALAPAKAQNVVYQGETSTLDVQQKPGDSYEWELYEDGTVNFALVAGNCPAASAFFVGSSSGASVNVKWMNPGIYFFKVTARDAAGCTNNLKIGIIEVKEGLSTAVIISPNPVCAGETASLQLTITGTGPWEITYTDGINSWTETGISDSGHTLKVSPDMTTLYWITSVKNQYRTNNVPSEKVLLEIYPKPVSSKIYQYEP